MRGRSSVPVPGAILRDERRARLVLLTALFLLAGCHVVRVYGPVVEPCKVPLQAPPTTEASVGR